MAPKTPVEVAPAIATAAEDIHAGHIENVLLDESSFGGALNRHDRLKIAIRYLATFTRCSFRPFTFVRMENNPPDRRSVAATPFEAVVT